MENSELTRHWLWMQAMNKAISIATERPKQKLYPSDKYHEWKHIHFETVQENCLRLALETLGKDVPQQGSCSGHGHLFMGYDVEADHTGVRAKYKEMEVTVSWPEVRKFIEKLLEPEDRQLDLFEILVREAMK